jgi:adenylate cyclase
LEAFLLGEVIQLATDDVKRKLTAILSADVVSYSRLMGEDELATVQTLTSYKETMTKLIKHYRGRVLDAIGDNLMAEFASVVDAVQCAVEVQQVLSSKNEELPENRKMFFRIGINLGDVIEEGDRIYGDGVNIAARVESLAEGGGVCISGSAFEQIENKLALGYQYMGEHTVKNIAKPVKVYRVPMGPVTEKEKKIAIRGWHKVTVGAVAILIIGFVLWALWNHYWRHTHPPIEVASVERMAYPLPDKPSIAVLPFVNMSGDPEQEYFSDGLSEEIITTISKVSDLLVIARQSTFSYKGKPVKIKQVAEELGVRYVLEGSVRKGENRVRVTAQLIDALTGHHLWAEAYDRELKDILVVQSEITKEIITALQVKLTKGEQARVFARGTDNVEAWSLGARAWKLCIRYSKENNAKARELLDRALELDPDYAFLWTALAHTHFLDGRFRWTKSPAESYRRALEFAKKALTLNEEDPMAHGYIGTIYLLQRKHDKAMAAGQRAISIDPNYADGYAILSQIMRYSGRFEEALPLIEKGIRLSPMPRVFYPWTLAHSYVMLGRYEEAIETYKQIRERCRRGECPPWWGKVVAIVSNMELGREEEARAQVEEYLRLRPTASLEGMRKGHPYKDPAHMERVISPLRKAGFPDKPPLPLPDKPSIAVLPFVNMSGDPEQEYFSDGISEEIITALSKTPKMFVIARTSSFKYKGKAVDVRTVGRELGVRYVLEGSVRRSENQLRITAQLVDAKTGNHLWAERYDREVEDIFAVQDEITMDIMTALQVKLASGEQARLIAKGTDNLEAYMKFLQGNYHFERGNKENNFLAQQIAKEIIALDSEYPAGYWLLGWTHLLDVYFRSTKSAKESLRQAFKMAQKTITLDESYAPAYSLLGYLLVTKREHDKAIAQGERAVALNPNSADAHAFLARSLNFAERCQESVAMYKKALRLNPFPPSWYYYQLSGAYNCVGKYEDAIEIGKKAVHLEPNNLWAHLVLVIVYNNSGREQEARAEAGEVLRIAPKFSVKHFGKTLPLKNQTRLTSLVEALRKAGLK